MNILVRAFVVALAVVLTACGATTLRSEQERISIATDVYLVLPSAGDLTESFDATQAIVADYEEDSYSFEAHIEARPGRITIVGLGALGGALFSISYDGAELVAAGSKEAQLVNAEYVLADVLLTHWNVDWLERRILGASISGSAQTGRRVVARDGEVVIRITYESGNSWGGAAQLTNLERQYVLQITTVEHVPQ
jgi:hypothetical protein